MYQYREQKFIAPEFIKKISSNENIETRNTIQNFYFAYLISHLKKTKSPGQDGRKYFRAIFFLSHLFRLYLDFLFIKLYPSFTSNLPYSYIVKQVCALNHFKTEGSLYKKFTICWDHIEWNSNWRFIPKSLPLQYMTAFLVPT